MARKLFHLFLLAITLSFLAVLPKHAAGDSGIVAVRIPADESMKLDRISIKGGLQIDYGSYSWSVMSPDQLLELDQAGVAYQVTKDPYVLTLGGQSFDPLISSPQIESNWESHPSQSGAGLHLIQFHGPTKANWLAELQSKGLEILQYIHPFTYVVWGELAELESTKTNPVVRWAGDYLPAYAVQAKHRTLNTDPIQVRAMVSPQADLAEILKAIESLGGSQLTTTSDLDPVFTLVRFTLPGDRLTAIASLTGVYSVQPVPTDGGDRGEMSNQVNAGNYYSTNQAFPGYLNWLNHLGLSGEGVVIANVDSGIDQNHPDLTNRILECTGTTCGGATSSNHGTHTAGIMAGDGSSEVRDAYSFLRGLGMAPGANLIEQVYSPTYTEEGGMLTLMTQSYQNGAVISGNSWGPASTALGYDADTRLVDIGVRDADPAQTGNQSLSFVLSIMNGYGGISSQGTPDEAKNTFTVGSTYMQYSNGSQNLRINDLSVNTAHGPALDGRNIPHLVAPGYYVDSTITNQSYGLMAGTSMASPQVTGAAALFVEHYRSQFGVDPSPALVKAAFLPVAHDLAGYRDADGGILEHPFDSKQGWGRLNAAEVLNPLGEVFYYDQPVILENSGEIWTVDLPITEPLHSLRAMLVWTDAPGHGLGEDTPAWVNDLDFSLSFNGQTYLGNNFGTGGYSVTGGVPDPMNNTEGIFLSEIPTGTYTLTVTAVNIAGDGVPNNGDGTDQDFALAVYIYGNTAPNFSSDPVIKATQNVPYVYNITAYDPDLIIGDTLTITAPIKPDWLTLTDVGYGSASLTGIPGETHIGDHLVEILVTDSLGLSDIQFFTIKVTENQELNKYIFPIFFH